MKRKHDDTKSIIQNLMGDHWYKENEVLIQCNERLRKSLLDMGNQLRSVQQRLENLQHTNHLLLGIIRNQRETIERQRGVNVFRTLDFSPEETTTDEELSQDLLL